jgi:hypothetical protein
MNSFETGLVVIAVLVGFGFLWGITSALGRIEGYLSRINDEVQRICE